MNDATNSADVRMQMETLRSDLGDNVEHTAENVRTMFDWRHHVSVHPWLCLTAAAAAGFAVVPRRPPLGHNGDCPSPESVAMPPPASGGYGIFAGLASVAASVALREAISRLGGYIENRIRQGYAPTRLQDGRSSPDVAVVDTSHDPGG